ncbi:MAG: magnesium/cobalt transporter CorA [Candidatus Altiarchaeota archaeon]
MPSFMRKRSRKAGLPPGTPMHIGEEKTGKVRITVIDYDEGHFKEAVVEKAEDCLIFKDNPTVTWINVDGIHDVDIIERFGKDFNFHPLLVEDIVNTEQRPKMEDFGDYMFLVLKMLTYDEKVKDLKIEQVSLILGRNFVLSFQEDIGDVFDPVRQRIREGKGRHRKNGADYLAYSLIDAIIDNYFIILEKVGEEIELLEEKVVSDPNRKVLREIHRLKRELIFLRKSVWPLREVVNGMEKADSPLIRKPTKIYLRDVYDHTIQVMDTVETFRDMTSGMLDIYLSSISNRLNEVMKVLTVIATIFMPLTFLAGVYGMNFHTDKSPWNMPELTWYYGYPMFWGIITIVAIIMLVYFRNKKWL